MQNHNLRFKAGSILGFMLWLFAFGFSLSLVLGQGGCVVLDVKELLTPEGPPNYEQISQCYYQTELRKSSSADVLTTVYLPEYELLSQSKSVVASTGQKKKGYKRWFKMIAFDEYDLRAKRKYLFIVDEKPKVLFTEPWASVKFDCEMILEAEVLDEPYANENARTIAILKRLLENFRGDIDEVSEDNNVLDTSGMIVNQALETVLVKLNSSPALARRLSEEDGLGFEHTSFDKGKIQMVVTDNIVALRLRLGSLVKKWKISIEKDTKKPMVETGN